MVKEPGEPQKEDLTIVDREELITRKNALQERIKADDFAGTWERKDVDSQMADIQEELARRPKEQVEK